MERHAFYARPSSHSFHLLSRATDRRTYRGDPPPAHPPVPAQSPHAFVRPSFFSAVVVVVCAPLTACADDCQPNGSLRLHWIFWTAAGCLLFTARADQVTSSEAAVGGDVGGHGKGRTGRIVSQIRWEERVGDKQARMCFFLQGPLLLLENGFWPRTVWVVHDGNI